MALLFRRLMGASSGYAVEGSHRNFLGAEFERSSGSSLLEDEEEEEEEEELLNHVEFTHNSQNKHLTRLNYFDSFKTMYDKEI